MVFSQFRSRFQAKRQQEQESEKTSAPEDQLANNNDGITGLPVDLSSVTDNPPPVLAPKDGVKSTIFEKDVDEEKGIRAGSSPPSTLDLDGFDENDPVIRDIPLSVRRVVSLHDDPTLPTLTFRFFFLSILFIVPGAFASQLGHFRTTYVPYSVFFVQIASNYVGLWMSKALPDWFIRIPFTKRGFSINPGPWSVKEHVLVTISAASGATYNLAFSPISLSELYFNHRVPGAVAVFFMMAVVWTGYSFAAISRQFLLYEPHYPWFQALCQTGLFEVQKKQNEEPTKLSRRQIKIFWGVLLGIAVWQFLPEYIFPFLSSLAFLCWVAPENATANFIGGGLGGMGFLNFSLDWSNLSNLNQMGSIFLTPFYTQVLCFLAFAINCWILIPWAKWGNLTTYKHGLMSNHVLMENGTRYPLTALLTPENTLNQTAYEQYGPLYLGGQQLWGMFFDYASFTSALSWMLCFGWGPISKAISKIRSRDRGAKGKSINWQYPDQLNILQRSYKEVPLWWYIALFLCSFVTIIAIIATGELYIPVWSYIVSLAIGAVLVTPLGWLYANTNYQLAIGTTNELLYGVMINAISGHKNPVGATVYSSIAGDAWYRAQYMLQDQKIGHYMHIPPRDTFFSQIWGCTLGVPINYAVIRWVLSTKSKMLTGEEPDPSGQWTAQSITTSLSTSVEYVLVGPTRLFQEETFKVLPYGFLLGIGAPLVLFALHKLFPNSKLKFRLWNTTIFFSAMTSFWGNLSTGYFSSIIGGYVIMRWAYRKRYALWARYNYILAAAFDAGFNLNLLLIFLCFGSGATIVMPNWWGNNEKSVERCFAL